MTLPATYRESTGVIKFETQAPPSGHGYRSTLRLASYGFSLTREELSASYAIIRHNIRTYKSAGVLAVVRGKQSAESELKKFEDSQDSSDRHEGWRYFIEKTNLKAGTDPVEATQRRQAELEGRESKALKETKTPIFPSPDPHR
jgi:hypothetical protein